jgi:hypothetical protein
MSEQIKKSKVKSKKAFAWFVARGGRKEAAAAALC